MKADGTHVPRLAALVMCCAATVVPGVVRGDEAADRKAQAQRLFAEGQTALDKGDATSGCLLMRESMDMFAVANSLFNVAQCDEREGKIAKALEHWKRGFTLIDATDKRAPVVKKAIEELEVRVPRLTILAPATLVPLEVLLDDQLVPLDNLTAALFVEPGPHVVIARKGGYEDGRIEVQLKERERAEVMAKPGSAIAAPNPTASATASTPPPVVPPPVKTSPLKIGGFAALGVGAAGLLGAVITGGVISSRHDDVEASCPNKKCTPDGLSLLDSQKTLVSLNTAFWGVGIAGGAVGAAMLILSSSKTRDDKAATITPVISRDRFGIGLSGRF
ncbi:MAG TPA: hypothetical protein PK156_09635 [Polyangium sp.]|nr:hypothetical protein [Polyangium sp.]